MEAWEHSSELSGVPKIRLKPAQVKKISKFKDILLPRGWSMTPTPALCDFLPNNRVWKGGGVGKEWGSRGTWQTEVLEATTAREDGPDIQKVVWLSQLDHALLWWDPISQIPNSVILRPWLSETKQGHFIPLSKHGQKRGHYAAHKIPHTTLSQPEWVTAPLHHDSFFRVQPPHR